jgi:hypothetical protein
MVTAAVSLEPVLAAGAIALVVIGGVAALLLANVVKRIAALIIAGFGAIVALAALGAPDSALVVGVAVVFAQTVVGVAILVRLQESYGAIEASEIDSADGDEDARDPVQ